MHFSHRFHPAGHGTFFSGHFGGQSHADFAWVYDCGSKRPSHLRGLIEDFESKLVCLLYQDHSDAMIDMLFVSHFDSDHVNGLDLFFEKFKVKTLVLPYAHPQARLQAACDVAEEEMEHAAATAALILDPVTYLELREYGGRIEQVLLIKGRGDGESGAEGRAVPPPGDGDELDRLPFETRPDGNPDHKAVNASSDDPVYGGLDAGLSLRLLIWDDSRAISARGLYEFVFYNKLPSAGVAPKSGRDLPQIARDVAELIRDYRMAGYRVARRGWRDALKSYYREQFGDTAKEKNEISLCVHGRPLSDNAMSPCELYRDFMDGPVMSLKILNGHKSGILLTGDIILKKKDLKALRKHLGDARWSGIGVMQIPHHGSAHNWQDGNMVHCQHHYSVICAPGSQHHPHPHVLKDVGNALLSNYGVAVAFDYHE